MLCSMYNIKLHKFNNYQYINDNAIMKPWLSFMKILSLRPTSNGIFILKNNNDDEYKKIINKYINAWINAELRYVMLDIGMIL